jgi:hypothetical protein
MPMLNPDYRPEGAAPFLNGEPPATFRIEDWLDPHDPLQKSTDAPFIRAVRRWLDARLVWNHSHPSKPRIQGVS